MNKVKVEIRWVDAWLDPDGDWYWNDSTVIGSTEFEDMVPYDQQFKDYLNDKFVGFYLMSSNFYFDMLPDGTVVMCDKETGCPIFAAIPIEV